MKQNIWTIKNILRIIISILVITSMIKSCSMAYTIDDVKFFIDYLYSQNVTNANYSSFHNRLGSLRSDWERMLQKAREQNIDLSQYTCWRAASTGRGTSCYLFGFKTSPEYHCTGYWYETTNTNSTYEGILWATDTNSWSTGNYRFSDDFCALNENEPTNGNYYNAIMQNKVEFPSKFKFTFFDERITATAPNGETAYCVFLNDMTDIQGIGYIENFEEHPNTQITIFMQNYRDADNVKVEALQPTDYQIVNGELWVKTITMWSPMVYEIVGIDGNDNFLAYYYIATASNPSGDPNFYGTPPGYDDNQFFLWKLLGNFGNDSGDPGSGLFGGIQNLFSGIYDKMFKVESGDILRALEHIKETNNITDMDLYSGDLEILNILDGEPDDFVISWNNIEYQNQTIIPSGDINFSKKIRDNQTLQQVMNWVHVILGFSLITIIIQEYWFTFLKILGVGVSVYEDNQEERDRLEEVYGTHVYDTMVTTQERDGTERIRKKYTTYRKRRR